MFSPFKLGFYLINGYQKIYISPLSDTAIYITLTPNQTQIQRVINGVIFLSEVLSIKPEWLNHYFLQHAI